MKRSTHAIAATLLAATFGAVLAAQKTTPTGPANAASPHVRSDWTIDGANISIEYGRPSLKGRTMGKDIDPFPGKEWRTGADQATTLKTDKPLKFGALAVPAGTYTLYSVPTDAGWNLIVSKKTGQWGIPYPGAGQDLGRAPMTVGKTKAPVEQLTISLDDTPAGGTLRVEWGATSASIPFTVG
jgi:hypothetical protein